MFRKSITLYMMALAALLCCLPLGAAGLGNGAILGDAAGLRDGGMEEGALSGHAAGQKDSALEKILQSREFDGASVSILAVTMQGDTLARHDCDRQLIPASNMKLLTTALAMHSLGSDYRYETSLGYTGEIRGGVLYGDLYIVGGGDPTIGSRNRIATPLATLLQQWCGMVREAGIREIQGYVIGDGRCFPEMMEQESWQLNDNGTYYGSGVSGLSFYENVIDFKVSPGDRPGSPLAISPTYPRMDWMTFDYACTTGRAGSGNSLYFYTNNFTAFGQMRGSLAVDRKPLTEHAANKFPEYTLAYYFAEYLESQGIMCEEGPGDTGFVFRPEDKDIVRAEDLTMIGRTLSPTLGKIVKTTNFDSNNLYAETLMKTLGKEYCGRGVYDSCYVAVSGLLGELGVPERNVKVVDGSGLSRQNHVSAEFMCNMLRAMADSPAYQDFVGTLPWPGSESTLKNTLKDAPEEVRTRIRMKSGTMDGVRCFSGYVLPAARGASATQTGQAGQTGQAASAGQTGQAGDAAGDTVIFSILINNYSVSTAALQKKINAILLLLAE